MSDPARDFTTVCSDPKRAVCNFCEKELSANVTYLKRHIASRACRAPDDVKRKMADRLLSEQHKVSVSTDRLQRLKRKLDETAVVNEAPQGDRPSPGVAIGQRSVDGYVHVMSEQERDTADELFARWVYREALPFRVSESANLQALVRKLNSAYKLPSKHSMANRLLKDAFAAQAAVVEPVYALLAKGLSFCNNMTQYWRHHSTPKQILERCQTAEYGAVRQLERPGATRWKSQVTAAECLSKTWAAMEKAVVDTSFRSLCLRSPSATQRKSAAETAAQVKEENNWDAVALVVGLLKPVAKALDVGQRDTGGLGLVMRSFFLMEEHFASFKFLATEVGRKLRTHCLSCQSSRRRYLLRPLHTLAYLLDPRFSRAAGQPSGVEIGAAIDLLKMLAKAHDTSDALTAANEMDESKLAADYPCPTTADIMSEYTDFRSRTGGTILMESTWEEGTVRNPLSWWQAWATHLPALLRIAQKVMKLPLSFSAGERSFSNAAHIQSKLRTRLTHERLHQLLCVYFNSRSLAHLPVGLGFRQLDTAVSSDGDEEEADDTDAVGIDDDGGLDLLAAAAALETIVEEGMQ
ncbi:hypothetical protein I4F81_007615 [Pyropia yezoensis]|uniref:Uncharacterized protein n=1 Tax=Pyropia yezoensis TaxID=2788 RepID=A0ACC3C4F8_PYRYE|nr:hypothetical protein I4F81_007615 [Neopyropia yezoensis]